MSLWAPFSDRWDEYRRLLVLPLPDVQIGTVNVLTFAPGVSQGIMYRLEGTVLYPFYSNPFHQAMRAWRAPIG